jgi:hypothetical protein
MKRQANETEWHMGIATPLLRAAREGN